MDFYKVPIGFGMVLAQNEAAMMRYAHLDEQQKQAILDKAHNVRSEQEMYTLVADLANGWANNVGVAISHPFSCNFTTV